jgi:nucleoside-diphosphate-sugar epimerase
VLVTGASGFVGRALLGALAERGRPARAALRRPDGGAALPAGTDAAVVGEIDGTTDWASALRGVDVVVHLAARVHMMRDDAADPLAEYRRVNTAGTERLARDAARAGVRRMVFVSSVKVHGEGGGPAPLRASDAPAPADPYGVSKAEAEEALHRVAAETGMEVVVLRPPLVYGPGVGANFLSLFRAVDRGLPLPLGRVRNRRSLVFVGNLADAILRAADHPDAAGRTFLVSDGEPVSTPALIRAVARALGRRPRLLPVPVALLHAAGAATGRGPAVSRLTGSLEVDSAPIRDTLAWTPPATLDEGLAATARWFRSRAGGGKG